MEKNLFEELQDKKKELVALAGEALKFGWIPEKKSNDANGVISYEEITDKLANDTLTIGVIGQMKCGKSTFLNSFVFEDDVLPAATTPMTAALSVITYGAEKKIVAEFYNQDEWAEQKMQAARPLEEVNGSLDESKVKAAKELVAKSAKLGVTLDSYLGKKQEDDFSNLIEYVGADGKYISITKSVTIYYPKEYLKGVEIVDTPGFNDPIVSREERTKEFLKKADVVLMMLYAGRPFDATDRDIIFKNVRQCGIGKVLVGINKYDIPFCNESNPEDEEQIKDYVKSEIRKACRECDDTTLDEILNEVEPIPLSAEMALLSELPMTKISASDTFGFAWKRHCDNFGISTQQEMRRYSHLDDLVNAVKTMVNTEKDKILFAKPLNAIIAAGDKRKAENAMELGKVNELISDLSKPDTELEEKEEKLAKANKRLTKKINGLGDDMVADLRDVVRKGKNELEDTTDAACRKMKSIIESDFGRFTSVDSIMPKLQGVEQKLTTRDLKRCVQNLGDEAKRKIDRSINGFFDDAEEILMRFVPDFDSREFVKNVQKEVRMEIQDGELFKYSSQDADDDYGFGNFIADFLNGASFGILGLAGKALNHSDAKINLLKAIGEIEAEFNPEPYLETIFATKDEIIDKVKQKFITELIEPLQEQISEIRTKQTDKEAKLSEANQKSEKLEAEKKVITQQLESINAMKSALS